MTGLASLLEVGRVAHLAVAEPSLRSTPVLYAPFGVSGEIVWCGAADFLGGGDRERSVEVAVCILPRGLGLAVEMYGTASCPVALQRVLRAPYVARFEAAQELLLRDRSLQLYGFTPVWSQLVPVGLGVLPGRLDAVPAA